jgi:hypothetical protein
MLHTPTYDRKTKAEASSKTAELLPIQEQLSYLPGWIARSSERESLPTRQSQPLQQRDNLRALQQTYGNQAVLRMMEALPTVKASPLSQDGGLKHKCACRNSAGMSETYTECQEKGETSQLERIQPKLTVSQPNDKYEREADRIADQVMRMPEPSIKGQIQPADEEKEGTIQTKAIASQITPLVQRQMDLDEEEKNSIVQPKGMPGQALTVAPHISAHIQNLKGRGQPLSKTTRSFFEPRFRHNFSQVRVYSDSETTLAVNSRAYTLGNDIVFESGQYNPHTYEGKKLIAHELAHIIQQRTGNVSNVINAKKHIFTPGRPAHNHKPGHWTAVQKDAKRKCNTNPFDSKTYSDENKINCVCGSFDPLHVLAIALVTEFRNKPIALQHLLHYLGGGGKTFIEDANLKSLINSDSQVRQKLANEIAKSRKGYVFIQQGDYSIQDFRFAFGGIDRVEWEIDKAAGTVDIWFIDRYDFHPVGFGYKKYPGPGDIFRITNCVHAAAVELKTKGAADYWMKGQATFPLSIFKVAP